MSERARERKKESKQIKEGESGREREKAPHSHCDSIWPVCGGVGVKG